mgnify:CR=1 FL=1
MNKLKSTKAITLIALVITIVVLLILAGITIGALTGNGLFDKAKTAREKSEKSQATETMNLKITNIQISSYSEKQELPDLQYLADKLCEDNDIEYVLSKSKNQASLDKIDVTNVASIFTKLKEYPYEFEIDNELKLASINGVKVSKSDTSMDECKITISEFGELSITDKQNIVSMAIVVNGTKCIGATQESTYTIELNVGEKADIFVYAIDSSAKIYKSNTVKYEQKEITSASEGNSTHTQVKNWESDWDLLSKIADVIAENSDKITKNTAEVNVKLRGKPYTIGVGDTAKVKYDGTEYEVIILGFNHDKLTNTTNGKTTAGISWQFVNALTTPKYMNSGSGHSGGWKDSYMRNTLMNTILTSGITDTQGKSIVEYMKAVNKNYVATENNSTVSTCSDKLWLLSSAEIWNSQQTKRGYTTPLARTDERYKYYDITVGNNNNTTVSKLVKYQQGTNTAVQWWLREIMYNWSKGFCYVTATGSCEFSDSDYNKYVAPGFAI